MDKTQSLHLVEMKWVESDNKWHLSSNEHFLQEFYNCANVNKFFLELDKENPCSYMVMITKVK